MVKILAKDIYGVLGMRGMGKSYCMGWLLEQNLSGYRAVILDTLREHHGFTKLGFYALFVRRPYTYKSYLEALRKYKRLIIIPYGVGLEQLAEEYEKVCRAIYTLGHTILMVDEAQHLAPQAQGIKPWFGKLVSWGRHRDVPILWTSQRPQEVDKLVMEQTTKLYLFRISLPNTLIWLRQYFPDVERLRTLEERKFICYDTSTGEITEGQAGARKAPHYG